MRQIEKITEVFTHQRDALLASCVLQHSGALHHVAQGPQADACMQRAVVARVGVRDVAGARHGMVLGVQVAIVICGQANVRG